MPGRGGTTVAHLAAHNGPTTLWARREELADQIDTEHRNGDYLPDYALHPDLQATSSLEEAVCTADVLVMGVPSHGFRSALEASRSHLRPWVPVVSLTKGLEQGTRLRMSQVVHEVLPGHPVGVLTGPNLAKEILAGHAAAAVVAMADDFVSSELQRIFATDLFRVYTNPDVIGCEVGGVLKNVIAIASGMADGLGTGDNTRGRGDHPGPGRAHPPRRGDGRRPDDVRRAWPAWATWSPRASARRAATATSASSSGKGRTIDEIIAEMNQVAEGVKSCRTVLELADEHGVEMPIAASVVGVVHGGDTAFDAYRGLISRKPTHERHPG